MLQLPCPWCGPRNGSEFAYVGEARPRPDVGDTSITAWRAYLYEHDNRCGWVAEHWFHRSGCRRYFTVERHTLTHEVRSITFSRRAGTPPGPHGSGGTDTPGGRDGTAPASRDEGGA